MFLTSEILRSPHAFSTRRGGVSMLPHTEGLNLAFGRGDEDEIVLQNLKIFAEAAGFDPHSVVSLPQIHSDIIYKVGAEDCGQGYDIREGIREGDGYVTCERGVVLGIKTADCVPILLEAERNGEVVAVGAVHAGWRGTASLIQQKCVGRLCSEFGVSPTHIRAAIGPCIHECCYEVDDPFLASVTAAFGEKMASGFITPKKDLPSKYLCDLVGMNRALLAEMGVPADRIGVVDLCTCCHPEIFYSHRYSKGKRGTMLSVICLK
jgi:YfiH family protein